MLNIRKTGLTLMALGLFSAPAFAQVGMNTSEDTNATTENPIVSQQFETYDTNEDGVISEAEFASSIDSEMSVDSFSKLDTDSNGSLDKDEFQAFAMMDTQPDHETTESDSY